MQSAKVKGRAGRHRDAGTTSCFLELPAIQEQRDSGVRKQAGAEQTTGRDDPEGCVSSLGNQDPVRVYLVNLILGVDFTEVEGQRGGEGGW